MWDQSAPSLGPEEHLARLDALAWVEAPTFAPVATDGAQLNRMIDVAGPVTA